MKVYNQEKLKLIQKIAPFLFVIKLLRLPLLLLIIPLRFFRKNRPDYFIADGFLIGDTILARPLIKAVLRKDPKAYYLGGKHAKYLLSDTQVKLMENQWPWATYDYSWQNLLKQVQIWYKILWLQPRNVIELRGDLRSLVFLYLTCPESLIGFSFTGGKMFLNQEPELPDKVLHLEVHNQALAKLLNLDYHLFDLKLSIDDAVFKNKNKIIGLSFSGSLLLKTLPAGIAKIVLTELKRDSSLKLVYLKSPNDYFLDQNPEAMLEAFQVEVWQGDFAAYVQKMQTLAGYIGMDSAGGHLAALFDIPALIFFGTQEPDFAKPISDKLLVLETKEALECRPCASKVCVNSQLQSCLNSISEIEIRQTIQKLLQNALKPNMACR